MDHILARNKYRLYMAMYSRGAVNPGDIKYHTALLLVPKDPDVDKEQAFRYHVKNNLVPGDKGYKVKWVFESVMTSNRTTRLRSVALLGKISITEESLRERLEAVPIVQEDKEWCCCHWAWSAIKALVDAKIINPLPLSPRNLWDKMYRETGHHQFALNVPLFTLNGNGNEIEPEIGPLE